MPARPAGRGATPPPDGVPRHIKMSNQLKNGNYECTICTESIRHAVATWSCEKCYSVLHLFCVKQWAKSGGSGEGTSFRCPSCQHQYPKHPSKYQCFCGKRRDPQPDGFLTPHSCGETCGRRRYHGCPHPCALQCHPGPCADCTHTAPAKQCPCGATEYTYPCGRPDPKTTCDNVCGKTLNCGKHKCAKPCHHGPCEDCGEKETVTCHCGRESTERPCGSSKYSCDNPCNALQRCGEHRCPVVCHPGNCPPCDFDPGVVFSCPCGKQPLATKRAKCTDPIPTCGQVCGKVLSCGRHECKKPCHVGPCDPCTARQNHHCLCGSTQRKLTCAEADAFRCDRKCKARLSCGKHECATICCPHRRAVDPSLHPCTRTCGKKLPCGHACQDPCHRGACGSCPNIITDELTCACGAEVLEPPLPCGTKPPECMRLCQRNEYQCGHDPLPHTCHLGPCPPCTAKVDRMCVGGHTTVKAVMCSSGDASCGNPCGKKLACGHGCPRRCHSGECVESDKRKKCVQPCGQPLACGHPCKAKCHAGRDMPCPPCAAVEEVPCECGLSTVKMTCDEFQHKMATVPDGGAVVGACSRDCDYKRRMEALGDLAAEPAAAGAGRFEGLAPPKVQSGPKMGTLYSFNLWSIASTGGREIVQHAERHLGAFVRSQEKTTMLPAMARDRRAVVHELAQYYAVDSEAIDREPNRTICLTRQPHSRIPAKLLSEVVGDASASPETVCRNVLAYRAAATKCIIVFEGLPEVLTESLINRVLKFHAGCYVVADSTAFPQIFPDGRVPLPHDGHKGEGSIPLLAVFSRGTDASAAFSSVRKAGCPVTFHWFGELPPPTNFTNREMGIKGMAPTQARYFCDEDSITPQQTGGRRTGNTSAPHPGSASWATMARRETARQKETSRPVQVANSNPFAALGR